MWLVVCSLGLAEEVFQYNPIGKRDPFTPLRTELPPAPPEGLMAWEIDELRLVGLTTGLEPTALFMDPEGQSWIVHEGDYVGRFWGVVTEIRLDEVHIREELVDVRTDGLVVRPYTLELHQGE